MILILAVMLSLADCRHLLEQNFGKEDVEAEKEIEHQIVNEVLAAPAPAQEPTQYHALHLLKTVSPPHNTKSSRSGYGAEVP